MTVRFGADAISESREAPSSSFHSRPRDQHLQSAAMLSQKRSSRRRIVRDKVQFVTPARSRPAATSNAFAKAFIT
jgi:hypothetical protein